jgi:hypothetical protein
VAVEPALWLLRSFRAMKCFLVVKAGFTKGGHWVAYFFFFSLLKSGTYSRRSALRMEK